MVAPVFYEDDSLRCFVASQIDVTVMRDRILQVEQDCEELAA